MREQLIQYIALLFAGASDCEEIKEEILQNTLDRYDDLVAQGKVPEAAYRLAIAGIGDINEILGTQNPVIPPVSANIESGKPQSDVDKKKVMRALSAGLYIISIAPLYIFNGNSVGVCSFLLLAATATVLWMLGYEKKEPAAAAGTACGQKRLPIWAIIPTLFVAGVFLSMTIGLHRTSNYHTIAATEAVETPLVDSGEAAVSNTVAIATATANVNVRSSPSPEASVVGMLSTGEYITVSLSENVSGIDWSYVTSPTVGWVLSEYIEMELIEDYAYSAPQQNIRAAVLNSTHIYTAPTPESSAACALNPGETVTVTRQETVNNTPWCYVTEPTSGWVQTVYLEFTDTVETPAIEESVATVQTGGYGCLAADVRELDIHWPYGSILILPKDTDRISVEETYDGTDCALLVTRADGELEIRFYNGEPEFWQNISKELTITVPTDWECESLEIIGGLTDVEICNLSVQELDYEGKSGSLDISTCAIENADLKTTSGSISLVGTAQQLELESSTAGIFAKLYNIPSRVEANSTEGDVTVMLPETTGFTLQCRHEFESDFDITEENDRYIAGDGFARIKLDVHKGLAAILKTK